MNEFSKYHPIVNFAYFLSVILLSMLIMNPICLAVSVFCSFLYSIVLSGGRALKFNLIYLLPMALLAAVFNPLFNHEGMTILAYFPNGNPLTEESIAYGFAAAAMLTAIICWMSCYNKIMTSDKFIYIFGRIIPSLSLILSMVLRFVPRFKVQLKEISNAQKCIGKSVTEGSLISRIKTACAILSAMITWSMENAVETADSMKSRGYGTANRTAYLIYKADRRDITVLTCIIVLVAYVAAGAMVGALYFSYFPSIRLPEITPYSMTVYIAYFILCIMPIIIEVREAVRWKALE